MAQSDQSDQAQTPDDVEGDGYYGDDEVDSEELDLSFLDDEDDSDEAEKRIK